ncbi:MAG: TRAP transporter small permease subunit [Pseudolabrys sp.]|nr:TRAP transporter small permease subunit [Pseudolabrys sp.]MDP2297123.1 TRAP transporter small permease subunit [Pseudolabrys sp.]
MQVAANQTRPGALERWAATIGAASMITSSALLVGMFVLINVEIGFRYILGSSTLLADEYAGYMFAALVYLALNHAILSEKLIAIDLPGNWRRFTAHPATRLFIAACILALNAILLYGSTLTLLGNIRFQSRSISYSKTLLALPQSLVVLGLALACIASIALLVRAGRSRARSE